MPKINKIAVIEDEQVSSLNPDVMDNPTMTSLQFLMPAIAVLGDILTETHDNYQQLASKSQTLPSAKETGRTLRYLSKHYAKVLMTALEYSYADIDMDALEDELEFEEENNSGEDEAAH